MSIRDELHDIKVLGGVRNYLVTLWQLRVVHAWDAWRCAAEKKRAERKERRLMKTSTWDALMENVEPGLIPENAEQEVHEDMLRDTIAIERRRWIERAQWIVVLLVAFGLGGIGGWYLQPEYAPEPIKCTVKVQGYGKEASIVDCEGVPE